MFSVVFRHLKVVRMVLLQSLTRKFLDMAASSVKDRFKCLDLACITVKFGLDYVFPLGQNVQRTMQKFTSNLPGAFLVMP